MAGEPEQLDRRALGALTAGSPAKAVGAAWAGAPQNGASPGDKGPSLAASIRAVEEATMATPLVLQSMCVALDHHNSTPREAEVVLNRLVDLLAPPQSPEVVQMVVSAGIPAAVVRILKKYRTDPALVALACMACARASGQSEGAAAHIRAGAIDEVCNLMDRHANHGGVQNVCLLCMAVLLKEGSAPRIAVSVGVVSRVLRALDFTSGREVQYNGLSALRLLAENGRAPRTGVQEAAMRAKVAHQGDDGVLDVANDVLCMVTPRFKEVICWHWQSGWCKLGPKCTYAHGPTDLFGESAK